VKACSARVAEKGSDEEGGVSLVCQEVTFASEGARELTWRGGSQL
jgi:hypothetical protein